MTLSICPECGESKVGAFVPCRSCGFKPLHSEQAHLAMMLTDHYLSASDLRKIAKKIKKGQEIELHYYFYPFWKKILWRVKKIFQLRPFT